MRIVALPSKLLSQPNRLVAGGPLNALGVFLDGREQIVRAAAGERGGGQRHSAISGMIFLYPMKIGSTLPACRVGLSLHRRSPALARARARDQVAKLVRPLSPARHENTLRITLCPKQFTRAA
jgi:hypothetical protein